MAALLMGLAAICGLASVVCGIIILIHAFQDEIWKGIVSLIFPLYLLYYAFAEYESDNKWLIVLTWLFGGGVGVALEAMAMAAR